MLRALLALYYLLSSQQSYEETEASNDNSASPKITLGFQSKASTLRTGILKAVLYNLKQ